MLYLAGDNNLSSYLKQAIYSLEKLPANPNLAIVLLYDGPGNGDSTRCLIQPGISCFEARGSWSLPLETEHNTGDPDTLASFMAWARLNYPAQSYYLSIADHGRGSSGIAWDDTDGEDYLSTSELENAFAQGTNNGKHPIDVVHYDACLMAMFEDAYLLKDYAGYLVASENLGWSVFAYDQYAQQVPASLQALTSMLSSVSTTTTPLDLARGVAAAYHNHPRLKYYPRTISALDLAQVELVRQKLDALSTLLQINIASETANIADARSFAQKFDSRDLLRITKEDDYLDLADLAEWLSILSSNPAIETAALDLSTSITSQLVVAEYHHSARVYYGSQSSYWDFSGAHGVSIYFPYRHGSDEYEAYKDHQLFDPFTSVSEWDNFLNVYFGENVLPSCLFMPTKLECQDVGRVEPLSVPLYKTYLPQILNQP